METGEHLYLYKGTVGIPTLAMVDDLAKISLCGVDSVKDNAFVNARIEQDKLSFNMTKCHHMHSGKTSRLCPGLKAHDSIMDTVLEEKYVGDIISADGKHGKNTASRRSKGIGVCNEIMHILNNLCLGPHYFNVALMLRQAMLIQVLLSNSETWLRLTKANLKKLESVDHMLLRKYLQTPISTPIAALFLETGCIPIRFIIKVRRIMFLHHILTREAGALINRVFWAQVETPAPGDWCQVVTEDLKDLGMTHLNFISISQMKSAALKSLLEKQVERTAHKYLEEEKEKSSKLRSWSFPELKLQPYLSNICSMPTKTKQLFFKWRTRMIKVGYNYGKREKCPLCADSNDDQQHLFNCPELDNNSTQTHNEFILNADNSNYTDTNWDVTYTSLMRLEKAIRKREIILEERAIQ